MNNIHKQAQTELTTLLELVDRKAAKGTSIQSPRKYVYQHDLSDLPQQRKTLISGKQFWPVQETHASWCLVVFIDRLARPITHCSDFNAWLFWHALLIIGGPQGQESSSERWAPRVYGQGPWRAVEIQKTGAAVAAFQGLYLHLGEERGGFWNEPWERERPWWVLDLIIHARPSMAAHRIEYRLRW